MRIRIVKSFVSRIGSKRWVLNPDSPEMDLPEGADWVIAGLAVPVKTTDQETAVQVKPASKRGKGKK